MMPEDLPSCPHCGSQAFKGGGGSFSPGFNQQSFSCTGCGAHVALTDHSAGTLLVFIRHDQMTPTEYEDTWNYPEAWTTWMNEVMIPTWRFRESEVKKHEDVEWCQWLAEVFYPAFPDLKGSLPAKYAEEGWPSPFTDGQISYGDCPPEAQKLMDDQFYQGDHGKHPKTRGSYVPLPPELERPVYPPKAPEGFAMYYWHRQEGWCVVSPAVSQIIEPPEDPILTRNREFFTAVWAAVEENLGTGLPEREKIKNGYGGREPWYTFTINGVTFTAGWRKRVVSIKAESPTGLPTGAIKALADRDRVTHEAFGPVITRTADDLERLIREESAGKSNPYSEETIQMLVDDHRERYPDGEQTRDGGWKNDRTEAHKLLIHAWGKDKTIEYLTTLIQTVQEAA